MKRGGPSHPKTYALAEALGIRRAYAVGILELLFHFAGQYAPAGDIGRYPDKRIAGACDWGGSVAKLIDSLVTCGWVDRHSVARLVVHDWHDHADRATLQRLSRLGQKPIEPNEEDNGNLCTQSETSGSQKNTLPEPEPEPHVEPVPAHTQEPHPLLVSAPRKAYAIDESQGDEPFERFWLMWCSLTKRGVRKLETGRTWVDVVKAEDEEAMIACLQRYGDSDEVSRGVVKNPDTWLREQANDGWSGTWPPKRGAVSSQTSKQQQNADAWGNA